MYAVALTAIQAVPHKTHKCTTRTEHTGINNSTHTAEASFCAETADNNAGRTATWTCRMEAIAGIRHYHGRGETNLRWGLALGGYIRVGTCTPHCSKSVSNRAALTPHASFAREAGNGCVECGNGGRLKNLRRRRVGSRPHMVQSILRDGALQVETAGEHTDHATGRRIPHPASTMQKPRNVDSQSSPYCCRGTSREEFASKHSGPLPAWQQYGNTYREAFKWVLGTPPATSMELTSTWLPLPRRVHENPPTITFSYSTLVLSHKDCQRASKSEQKILRNGQTYVTPPPPPPRTRSIHNLSHPNADTETSMPSHPTKPVTLTPEGSLDAEKTKCNPHTVNLATW